MGTVSRQTAGFLSTPYPFVMALTGENRWKHSDCAIDWAAGSMCHPAADGRPYPTRADAALLEILRLVRATGLDVPLFADIVDADYVEAEAKHILGDEDACIDVQTVINRLAMDAYSRVRPLTLFA